MTTTSVDCDELEWLLGVAQEGMAALEAKGSAASLTMMTRVMAGTMDMEAYKTWDTTVHRVSTNALSIKSVKLKGLAHAMRQAVRKRKRSPAPSPVPVPAIVVADVLPMAGV
jgi:hypothetical protein